MDVKVGNIEKGTFNRQKGRTQTLKNRLSEGFRMSRWTILDVLVRSQKKGENAARIGLPVIYKKATFASREKLTSHTRHFQKTKTG